MGISKDAGLPLSIKAFVAVAVASSIWLLLATPSSFGVASFILQIVFLIYLYRGEFLAWLLFVVTAVIGIPTVLVTGSGILAAASGAVGLALLLTPASIRWCRPSKAPPPQPSVY